MINKFLLLVVLCISTTMTHAQVGDAPNLAEDGKGVLSTAESALSALETELVVDNTVGDGLSVSIKSLELLRGIAEQYPNQLERLVQLSRNIPNSITKRTILLRELAYYVDSHRYLIQHVLENSKPVGSIDSNLVDPSNVKAKAEVLAALHITHAIISNKSTVAYDLYDLVVRVISDTNVPELALAAINELHIWNIAPSSRIKLHKVLKKRVASLSKAPNDNDLINNHSLLLLGLHRLLCELNPSIENQQALIKVLLDPLDDEYANSAIFAISQCSTELNQDTISWLMKVAEYKGLRIETRSLAMGIVQEKTNNDDVFKEAAAIKKVLFTREK